MTSNDREPRAVLFDVDGTLVDSNYLHIDAWHRAFVDVGHPVVGWRIHRALGMDSDRLLDELLSEDAQRLGPDAKERHRIAYREQQDRLLPFDGVSEMLDDIRGRGIIVVLATSAPKEELDVLLKALNLPPDRILTTSADDVDTAKPDPSIVRVALDRAGVEARDAVFVGDTAWDMVAATKAGVPAIGVLTGGIGTNELVDAGAGEVVSDVAALRGRWA